MISNDRIPMQREVYNFLRSLTIKFTPMAHLVNESLERQGYVVNIADPTTWKYYLNLQGKYHESDTPMYVTSLDTQERILFSPDVLSEHRRTRSVYIPGGLYYKRLCSLYPEQVDLIKSILFPVTDVEKAITSDDFTILNYGTGYLEPWEEAPIVTDLVDFLAIVKERWYFDFLDDEPYFYYSFWGSLWFWLALVIMTSRESFIKTPYVHSFHVWSRLVGAGLDDYSDILSREKSMMFYQNIDYLKANAGKRGNLILLANKLLLDFGVSLYSRRVVQESESGAANYQLTPQLQAVRIPLDNAAISAEISSESVAVIQNQVYSKGLAASNTAEAAEAKERAVGDTTLNEFSTKFLEIRPLTRNKTYSDVLNVFILETLSTSILNNYYAEPVRATDLATGASFYLYPRQLLALYHYACQKALGLEPDLIPTKFFFYRSFLTQIKPNTKKKLIKGDDEIYISMYVDAPSFLSGMEYNTAIADPDAFTEMLTRQWLKYMEHMLLDQNTKIDRVHTILEYLSSLCHERRIEEHELVPGFTTYTRWLGAEGIDVAGSLLAQYDTLPNPKLSWENLADSIITALVPINDTLGFFGNFTLSDFGYQRLRQLFVQMCSYRVVFLESSRETPEYGIGAKWSTDYGSSYIGTFRERVNLRHVRWTSLISQHRQYEMPICVFGEYQTKVKQNTKYSVTYDTLMGPKKTHMLREHLQVYTTTFGDTNVTGGLVSGRLGISLVGLTDGNGSMR